jgi:hypothetical protein
MINKKVGMIAAALVGTLLALAQPASATVRSWSAPWGQGGACDRKIDNGFVVEACLVQSDSGVSYKAILNVGNERSSGVQMSAAVINMWAVPSPATKIRDDGCLNSGLSAGYGATCYGTLTTKSTICSIKPGASYITANAAITVSSHRIMVQSPGIYVGC